MWYVLVRMDPRYSCPLSSTYSRQETKAREKREKEDWQRGRHEMPGVLPLASRHFPSYTGFELWHLQQRKRVEEEQPHNLTLGWQARQPLEDARQHPTRKGFNCLERRSRDGEGEGGVV